MLLKSEPGRLWHFRGVLKLEMKTGIHELTGVPIRAKPQSKYAACGPGRSPNDCKCQILT